MIYYKEYEVKAKIKVVENDETGEINFEVEIPKDLENIKLAKEGSRLGIKMNPNFEEKKLLVEAKLLRK